MKSKILIILAIIAVIFGTTYNSFAVTKKELNNQNNELDTKIDKTKKEIEHIENNLSDAVKEVQELVVQISTYEKQIADLDTKIENISKQIVQTENDIVQKEKESTEKQELLNKRLIAIYESGNTSYLDMLLTSSDLSDFLSKYYLISEIAEYDVNLINSLKNAKSELEVAKTNLETDKKSLELSKEEQIEKQEALKKIKAEKDSKVANLNSEEKALESELEEFENDKKEIQTRLAEIARQESLNDNSPKVNNSKIEPSSYGYIFPVPGLSKANINNKNFPSYKGHTGIDININVVGKSIVAVKSGTVETSTAMRNPDGSYKSYGEYVVINHHDGTMTLYGHMLSGSRKVSEGDEVSQGQVIGTVGSTGNSTGPHLHFEVLIKGVPQNPMSYLP